MTVATRPSVRILHLSDTHLFGDGTLHHGVVDTTGALRRALYRAAGLTGIDAVVLSGDLSDDGSEASYRILRDLVEPWAADRGAAVLYTMGNHDHPAGFEAVLGDRVGVTEVRGLRLIRLDSSVPGRGYGAIGAEQLDQLAAHLSVDAPHGTVVVVHHPPTDAHTPLLRALQLTEPERLLAVCAAGGVRLILAGHYHHGMVAFERGIPVVAAPAVANTADTAAEGSREKAHVGTGFAVVEVSMGDDVINGEAAGGFSARFVTAASADDGRELFDLGPEEIAAIAAQAGREGK